LEGSTKKETLVVADGIRPVIIDVTCLRDDEWMLLFGNIKLGGIAGVLLLSRLLVGARAFCFWFIVI